MIRCAAKGRVFVLALGYLAVVIEIIHHRPLGEKDAVGGEMAVEVGFLLVYQEASELLRRRGDFPVVGSEHGMVIGRDRGVFDLLVATAARGKAERRRKHKKDD